MMRAGPRPRGVLSLAWDAWRTERRGAGAVAARQGERLAALVAHARQRSRFYAEHYAHLPGDGVSLTRLPPVTKAALMARFDDWLADPTVTLRDVEGFAADPARIGELYRGRYTVWHSSGSTGLPAFFVQDEGAMAVYEALDLARTLPRWLAWRDLGPLARGRFRGAGILALGGHYAGIGLVAHRWRRRPRRRRNARLLSVLAPVAEIVDALNAWQPVILGGYASVLTLLADEQEAGRLHIRPGLVFSASEPLLEGDRARIERALGCRVRENYACSEALALTAECKRGWHHVNADWMIVEPVDEALRPVPPGRLSHTALITNLANWVQPIIRYDLGDRVRLRAGPCGCGSPLPALQVEGRTDENLAFRAPDGTIVRLSAMALTTVTYETPGVRRYQLVQTGAQRLTVRFEADPGAEDAVWAGLEARLRAYLTAQGLPTVAVDRAREAPATIPGSGKMRHVLSGLAEGAAADVPLPG
jgi:phenylacetate-coenzyme A ligase PaaK-like adenylate-forming protein